MDVKEILTKQMVAEGKTASQIKQVVESKTVERVADACAEHEGLIPAMAEESAKRLEAKLWQLDRQIRDVDHRLKGMIQNIQKVNETVDSYVDDGKNRIIEDQKMKDGLILYHHMLTVTKEVFGEENMTVEVMQKAIEAASYGLWRGIMGSKNEQSANTMNKDWRRI